MTIPSREEQASAPELEGFIMDQFDNENISQEIIDRLVDGELDETVRAAVLRRLEADPLLCKRIAIAFLENQAWREAFSTYCSALAPRTKSEGSLGTQFFEKRRREAQSNEIGPGEALSKDTLPQIIKPSADMPRRCPQVSTLGWLVAVAASFILAFLASWYIQSFWLTGARYKPTLSAGSLAANQGQVSSENQAVPVKPDGPMAVSPHIEMVSVPLPVDDAGTWATMEVPFISFPGAEVTEVLPGGMIPTEILESLGAQGHVVEQERRFVPVALPDGRQSVVPIDQVRIRFVDRPKR